MTAFCEVYTLSLTYDWKAWDRFPVPSETETTTSATISPYDSIANSTQSLLRNRPPLNISGDIYQDVVVTAVSVCFIKHKWVRSQNGIKDTNVLTSHSIEGCVCVFLIDKRSECKEAVKAEVCVEVVVVVVAFDHFFDTQDKFSHAFFKHCKCFAKLCVCVFLSYTSKPVATFSDLWYFQFFIFESSVTSSSLQKYYKKGFTNNRHCAWVWRERSK